MQPLDIKTAVGNKTLWVKQTIVAVMSCSFNSFFNDMGQPCSGGNSARLRYLVAEKQSDFTPVLETFVRRFMAGPLRETCI